MRDLMLHRLALFAAVLVTVLATPAWGHGDLQSTSPRDGQRVKEPPREVTISLTEAPTEQGLEATARDGCNEKIPAAVSVEESTVVMTLEGGAPGHWMVKYRAVSSVDGHQTRGKFHFMVAGPHDCSEGEEDEGGDDIAANDQPGIVENEDPPDGSSTTWIWIVLAGTVVLAGLAFVVRRASQ
jgi:methionine-rich copper-binding protein CopC